MKTKTNIEYYVFPLYENIIHRVGDYILKITSSLDELDKICIIFSGKRPELFLKKYLAEKIKHSFVPPKIFSIEEFITYILSQFEDITCLNDIDAVYSLYTIVKGKHLSDSFNSFFNFLPWGYEIYSFIEELNLENIPPTDLLKITSLSVTDIAIPNSVNLMIKDIVEIYNKFYTFLEQKKWYTRGMMFNLVSKYVQKIQNDKFNKIIFVTPFYLHKTELNLISSLQQNNNITIFFQTDKDNKWMSLKRIEEHLGIKIELKHEDNNSSPNLYFYSAFDKESEINFVHNILKQIDETEIDKTAIVLPDQETATVLINSIPEKIKEFNLVCGYPVKRSSIYNLFDIIFTSQINKKKKGYYSRYYIETITNPLVKNLNFDLPEGTVALIVQTIESILSGKIEDKELSKIMFVNLRDVEINNTVYQTITKTLSLNNIIIPIEKIKHVIHTLHQLLFYQWENIETFAQCCNSVKKLLDVMLENNKMEEHFFNLKVVDKLYDTVDMFNHTMFVNEKFSKEEIFKIFMSEIEKVRISFIGSPLKGLQILGFYETRNLNFDNLIITDVNEGILPFLKTKSVLIPREIMLAVGIDRIEIEEEIQRYHFQRLISSAKNVHIVYIETEKDERSRFVEEIIWQEQKRRKELDIKNLTYGFFKINLKLKKKEVKKTAEIVEHLTNMYYSISSLDLYLRCPLKFYFGYILSLEESEVSVDEPEGKDIGNFLHSLLEEAFHQFEGKQPVIDDKFCTYFLDLFNTKFDKEIGRQFKTESYIVKEVMQFYLSNFISYEHRRLEEQQVKKILLLERRFNDNFVLNSGKKINFTCRVDRVDELSSGGLIVIDYKTGEVPIMNKDIKKMALTREDIKKKIKSFQLPLYVYIISRKYNTDMVDAMFYNIKEPEDINLLFKDNNKMSRDEITTQVNQALNFIIEEILDQNIPFYADDTEPRQCEFCEYNILCR